MSSENSTKVNNLEFVGRLIDIFDTDEPKILQRKLEIDYQSAKNYLNGRKPKAEILERIAEKTGVSINWLLTGEGKKYIFDNGDSDYDGVSVVSPTQKFLIDSFEDAVLEIIRENVPQIIRNEIELAKGNLLTRKSQILKNTVEMSSFDEFDEVTKDYVETELESDRKRKAG